MNPIPSWQNRTPDHNATNSGDHVAWAGEINTQIAFKDHWDLREFHRAPVVGQSSFVVANDGLILDIEDFFSGVLGRIIAPDRAIFASPQTVVTTTGEIWRVLGRRVSDGYVVVAISADELVSNADAVLESNATRFGSSVEEAVAVGKKGVDGAVDFAVVRSDGELAFAWGGAPLKTEGISPSVVSAQFEQIMSRGKSYTLYREPIATTSGAPAGTIVVAKNVELEIQALQSYDRLNYWIVGIALALATTVILTFLAREILSQPRAITVEEALKGGESKTLEFKSTLHWDSNQGKALDERRLAALRSIAGFLNAKGGTLCIGIREDREGRPYVRGLRDDLNLFHGNLDALRRSLVDQVSQHIGPEFASFIADRVEEVQGELCWLITVERAPDPVFVHWKGLSPFYVREGPRTNELDNESTWRYIRNHWH